MQMRPRAGCPKHMALTTVASALATDCDAAVAVLNRAAVDTSTVSMAEAAKAGVMVPVIAGVAVFTDEPSVAVLAAPVKAELACRIREKRGA